MSRIGKQPIAIETGVSVTIKDGSVFVAGPKGQMEVNLPKGIFAQINNNQLEIKTDIKGKTGLYGLYRTLVSNAIYGVKNSWSKQLELVGVGYRAEISGDKLILHLGFAIPVQIQVPSGVSFQIAENKITIFGVDKYLVGETAAKIKKIKPPEPYKGKGIRYSGEYIRRKAGKAAKTVGSAVGAK